MEPLARCQSAKVKVDGTSGISNVRASTIVSGFVRYLLCLLGLVFAFPLIALVRFAITTPITISGIAYLIGYSLAIIGLITAPLWRKFSSVIILTGITAILLIAGTRIAFAKRQEESSKLKMVLLLQNKETRWINYLIDEQDGVLFGEAALLRLGGVWPQEHENIVPSLYEGYSELRTIQSVFPSPFASTYLNLEKPAGFDAIVIEPEEHAPKFGLVFLHGYMGNVTIQCWRIAQAIEKLGGLTICPSTDWTGAWWGSSGQAMVRATFLYLHERGIQIIYLGGFSNGSLGAGRLAPSLAGEDDSLNGLILIAGVSNASEIRKMGFPILVIQGTQDQRMPATNAQQFTEEVGGLVTYVEIESDHFLIMKQPALVQRAITNWLEDREPISWRGNH